MIKSVFTEEPSIEISAARLIREDIDDTMRHTVQISVNGLPISKNSSEIRPKSKNLSSRKN